MKRLIWIIVVALMVSCSPEMEYDFPENDLITGLASPVWLDQGENAVHLGDYFLQPNIVDSVILGDYPLSLQEDGTIVSITAQADDPPIRELKIYAEGSLHSIPVMDSRKVRVEFQMDPMGRAYQNVALAGEFNGWTPSRTPLTLKDGLWTAELYLDRGKYQYQVVRDGFQGTDPSNPDSVDNNMGGYNSVLYAGGKSFPEKIFLTTDDAERGRVEIESSRQPDGVFVLWENSRIPSAGIEIEEDEFSFRIPAQAKEMGLSYCRVWAYDSAGISNDLLIPLRDGEIVMSPAKLPRTDFRKAIIYNTFVDRFCNGDPGNDRPLNTPEVLPPADYHGGDIAGITQKIRDGYFDLLGVNTLWISPVVRNPEEPFGYWPNPESKFSAYHGYWPISFTQIDDRFGTPDEFREMVSAAHEKEMNALLDFVANHVHEQHPVYQENPGWATDLYLPDGTLNTEKWDEYRLTTWFDVFLPTLNLEVPEVTQMLADSALWWLKEYQLDGFRHDATKHIPEIFWRTLTSQVKKEVIAAEDRQVLQIGETYGSPQLISSYVGSGMLDGQFDFNVYDAALGAFARDGESFHNLHSRLMQSLDYYGYHNLMGYITGNQDRGRFISYAGGDLLFEEDAKAAGWTRKIGVGDPSAYKKLQMLMAFNMTIPGIPVIYYGDEFGMPGGNDPDSRRMMRFEGLSELEQENLEVTARLTRIRSNHMSLLYGDLYPLLVEQNVYAFARRYFEEVTLVIFNKGQNTEERAFDLDRLDADEVVDLYGESCSIAENELKVTLPPRSFTIVVMKD